MKTSRFLDFRRAFLRRWSVGPFNRFVELVGQPVFVAVVVCLAFLAKEKENTIPAFANAFFYFTGLYAFWVGLFGSCQSINGEVQNGEWSYWTLGLRRNIPRHVLSVFSVNLAYTFWIVLLFLASVVAVSGILSTSRDFNPFIACFLTQNNASADSLWQCGYMLKPILVGKLGVLGPLLFSSGLYAISLLTAAVCGICFGMFLSVAFRDPSVSLNASVAFVVLLGMLSLLGLQGDKSRCSPKDNKSLDRCFASWYESVRSDETASGSDATDFLVGVSRILPQRYFFNIARMPMEKHVDKIIVENIRKELDERAAENVDENEGWWRKAEGTLNNHGRAAWGLDDTDTPEDLKQLATAILADATFFGKHGIGLWFPTFAKAIALETIPLVAMCFFCLLFVNAGVLWLPAYRQLR